MSPSGLFPPMKDPACPFLFESMEPKDASGHLVSTLPAAAHPLPCHIPSDSCHLQSFITRCVPPPSLQAAQSSLLPQSCPCAPAPFSLIPAAHLGRSFPWAMEKHCTRSCVRTPSTQHRHLENAAAKPQGTLQRRLSNRRDTSEEPLSS